MVVGSRALLYVHMALLSSMPLLLSVPLAPSQAFTAACTPEFYVFDKNHKLAYHGQYDDSRLVRAALSPYSVLGVILSFSSAISKAACIHRHGRTWCHVAAAS